MGGKGLKFYLTYIYYATGFPSFKQTEFFLTSKSMYTKNEEFHLRIKDF